MEKEIKNTNIYLVSQDVFNNRKYTFNLVINLSLFLKFTGDDITDTRRFAFRELVESVECDNVGGGMNALVIYGSMLESRDIISIKKRIFRILLNNGISNNHSHLWMLTDIIYRQAMDLNFHVKCGSYTAQVALKNHAKNTLKAKSIEENDSTNPEDLVFATIKAGIEKHVREFFDKENMSSVDEGAKLIQAYSNKMYNATIENLNKMHDALSEYSIEFLKKEGIIKEVDKTPANNIEGKIICISGSTKLKPQIIAMKNALEKYGAIVLAPEYYSQYEGVELTEKQLEVLKKVHMEKLNGCDLHVAIAELEPSQAFNVNKFTIDDSVTDELNHTIDIYTGTLIIPVSSTMTDQTYIEKVAKCSAAVIAASGYLNAVYSVQSFSDAIILDTGIINE